MSDFLARAFDWPTIPMTVVLLICCAYWMLVMVGLMDLDTFDFDFSVDAEPVFGGTGVGFLSLRMLNLGNVPVMLWLSFFSLSGWLISMGIDRLPRPESWEARLVAIGRNTALALVATKILTNPLRGRFDPKEPNRVVDLLGRTGVVVSGEVNSESGQLRVETNAAPLLLNVMCRSGVIPKHSQARLIGYETEVRQYIVEIVPEEGSSQ